MKTQQFKAPSWKAGALPEEQTHFEYDAYGNTTLTRQKSGPMVTEVHTQYDRLSRPLKRTDEAGLVTTWQYSSDALTTTMIAPTGATYITTTYLDGSLRSETGTGQRHKYYTHQLTDEGFLTRIRYDSTNGPIASETTVDALGRTVFTRVPAADHTGAMHEERHYYNAQGRLERVTRTGKPDILYQYDPMGNLVRECEKLSPGTTPTPGLDRITDYTTQYCSHEPVAALSTQWLADTKQAPALQTYLKTTRTRVNSSSSSNNSTHTTWSSISNLASGLDAMEEELTPQGARQLNAQNHQGVVSIAYSTSNNLVNTTLQTDVYGEELSLTRPDAQGVTHYHRDRDIQGTTLTITDARGNNIKHRYDKTGRLITTTDATQATLVSNTYAPQTGLLTQTTDAEGNTIHYRYDIRGRKTAQYGTGTYPTAYQYDQQDQLVKLHTWRNSAETISGDPTGKLGADTTTWTYHPATGLLTSKQYPDGTRETRTYDLTGRLRVYTAPSGKTTTHTYITGHDKPVKTVYRDPQGDSSGDPVKYAYNIWGEPTYCASNHGGDIFFWHDKHGALTTEAHPGKGVILHHLYNNTGVYAGCRLEHDWGTTILEETITYDHLDRIQSVSQSGAGTLLYGYEQLTGMQNTLTYPNGVVKTITQEDRRDYIHTTDYRRPGQTTALFTQQTQWSPAGRLAGDTRELAGDMKRINAYSYNTRGELTGAILGGFGTYDWQYDNIGNRTTAGQTAYQTNKLNQYTNLTTTGTGAFTPRYDRDGNQLKLNTLTGEWDVTYNTANRPAQYRSDQEEWNYWYDPLGRKTRSLQNKPQQHEKRYIYRGNQILAILNAEQVKYTEYDEYEEQFLVRQSFLWDPANPVATRPLATTGLDFNIGMICETTMMIEEETTMVEEETTMMEEETTMVEEETTMMSTAGAVRLNTSANMPTPETTPGQPAQSKQASAPTRTEPKRYPEPGKTYYYIHDHNKNVVAMMDRDANIVARYIYDPYGNTLLANGDMAEANPLRYSSEFHNRVTGLTDYLYRSYNPTDGRWTQRDPIHEQGGVNLYEFVNNNPANLFDKLGLASAGGTIIFGFNLSDDGRKGVHCSFTVTSKFPMNKHSSVDAGAFVSLRKNMMGSNGNQWSRDAGFTVGFNANWGHQKNPMPQYLLNRHTSRGNNMDNNQSATFAMTYNCNQATGEWQLNHSANLRFGNLSAFYQNDKTPWALDGWYEGTDQAWTASASLSYMFSDDLIGRLGYEQFTGIPLDRSENPDPSKQPYYKQNGDEHLNKGEVFGGILNGSNVFDLGWKGTHIGQKFVHSKMLNPPIPNFVVTEKPGITAGHYQFVNKSIR